MIDEGSEHHFARRSQPVKAPVPCEVLYQRKDSQYRSKNSQNISKQEETCTGCEEVRGHYEGHNQEEKHRHYRARGFHIHR
jgi:hypothetical protein